MSFINLTLRVYRKGKLLLNKLKHYKKFHISFSSFKIKELPCQLNIQVFETEFKIFWIKKRIQFLTTHFFLN